METTNAIDVDLTKERKRETERVGGDLAVQNVNVCQSIFGLCFWSQQVSGIESINAKKMDSQRTSKWLGFFLLLMMALIRASYRPASRQKSAQEKKDFKLMSN